jgi:hypothetical protein
MEETQVKSKQQPRAARHRHPGDRNPRWTPLLERIQLDAAGLDCGAQHHYVAVPPDRDPQAE